MTCQRKKELEMMEIPARYIPTKCRQDLAFLLDPIKSMCDKDYRFFAEMNNILPEQWSYLDAQKHPGNTSSFCIILQYLIQRDGDNFKVFTVYQTFQKMKTQGPQIIDKYMPEIKNNFRMDTRVGQENSEATLCECDQCQRSERPQIYASVNSHIADTERSLTLNYFGKASVESKYCGTGVAQSTSYDPRGPEPAGKFPFGPSSNECVLNKDRQTFRSTKHLQPTFLQPADSCKEQITSANSYLMDKSSTNPYALISPGNHQLMSQLNNLSLNIPSKDGLPLNVLPGDDLVLNIPSRDDIVLNIPPRDDIVLNIPPRDGLVLNIPSRDDRVLNIPPRDDLSSYNTLSTDGLSSDNVRQDDLMSSCYIPPGDTRHLTSVKKPIDASSVQEPLILQIKETLSPDGLHFVLIMGGDKNDPERLAEELKSLCSFLDTKNISYVAVFPSLSLISLSGKTHNFPDCDLQSCQSFIEKCYLKAWKILVVVSPGYQQYAEKSTDKEVPEVQRDIICTLHEKIKKEQAETKNGRTRFRPVLLTNMNTNRAHIPSFLDRMVFSLFPEENGSDSLSEMLLGELVEYT